jgi:hypothetical protein
MKVSVLLAALFVFLVCLLTSCVAHGQPSGNKSRGKEIGVKFYKNIELLGFAFFIGSMASDADREEAKMPNGIPKREWFAYDLLLYKKYNSFATHPDLLTVAHFGEQHEGSHLARLLLQLPEFPHAEIKPEQDEPILQLFIRPGDSAASVKEVLAFVAAANRLYKAVDFDAYLKESAPYYKKALQEIRSVLPDARLITTMEQFHRRQFDHYALLPSLTIPSGMAFGVNYTLKGKSTVMNLFGPFAVPQLKDTANLNMGFANADHIRELSTHEFGHSFSNPAVAQIPPSLVKETAALYEPVKEAMENQGYNDWKSCLFEYFVRAGEVVIARKLGNGPSADRLLQHYVRDRKFVYLPLVIEELERYDRAPWMSYLQASIKVMEKLKAEALKK